MTLSDRALALALLRTHYPRTANEAVATYSAAEVALWEFDVPSAQAFEWLDTLEYMRKSLKLAELQAGMEAKS